MINKNSRLHKLPSHFWSILSLGAVIGTAIAILLINTYAAAILSDLIDLLNLNGPAAIFVPLAWIGLLGATGGSEIAALVLASQTKASNLTFLWNFILNAAIIVGITSGLLLAATIPSVLNFARTMVRDAFPNVLPWIFIAGFGFIISVSISFAAYLGVLRLRK